MLRKNSLQNLIFRGIVFFSLISLFLPLETFARKKKPLEKAPEMECTLATISICYEKALYFYRIGDFAKAKEFFEMVVALDVGYRKAGPYLKKSTRKVTEQVIAEQAREQRRYLEEQREREEAWLGEQQGLEGVQRGSSTSYASEKESGAGVYRVGVGDVLEISVWRNSDLDKSVIVRPDGVISYPLVGDLPVIGRTLTEVDDAITKALTDYVRTPLVSIAVTRFGGTKVIILGEVAGPGIYSPPGGGSVIDVIALAGGFKDNAVKKGVFLVRGGMASPQVYRLNLARVFKGDLGQNIPVQSNDIIYIPKTFITKFNEAVSKINPLLSNTLLTTTVYRDIKNLSKGK